MKKFLIILYLVAIIFFIIVKFNPDFDFSDFFNKKFFTEEKTEEKVVEISEQPAENLAEEVIKEATGETERLPDPILGDLFSDVREEMAGFLEYLYRLASNNDREGLKELVSGYSINLIGAFEEEIDDYVEDLILNSDPQPEEIQVEDIFLLDNGVILFKELSKINGEYYERYFPIVSEKNQWKINLYGLIDAIYFDPQYEEGKISIDVDTVARGINEMNVIFRMVNNTDKKITIGKNGRFKTGIELNGDIHYSDFEDEIELMPGEVSEYYYDVFPDLSTIPDFPTKFNVYNVILHGGEEISVSSDL